MSTSIQTGREQPVVDRMDEPAPARAPAASQPSTWAHCEPRGDAPRTARRLRVLRRAMRALGAGALGFDSPASLLARLAVPSFADVCVVDLVDEHGQLQRAEVVPGDVRHAELAAFLAASHERLQGLVREAVRSARGLLRSACPSWGAATMIVPMMGVGRVVGALSFITSRSRRGYRVGDLALAEALAAHAGLHVECAHLRRTTREALRARDDLLCAFGADRSLSELPCATRVRASYATPCRVGCRPRRLVADALDRFVSVALAKGLVLRSFVQRGLPNVHADAERIAHVFSHLLESAAGSAKENESVEIRAERCGQGVAFYVVHARPGTAFDGLTHRQAIGSDGAVVDGRRNMAFEICVWIVEAHGGTVAVESGALGASTVRFTLPASESAWRTATG